MRLFFAIEVPEPLRRAISDRGRALGTGVRPVAADRVHLTLKFVGEVAPDTVPALVDAARVAVTGSPFEFELAGGGVFPPRGRPRVLWVSVQGDGGRLVALAEALDRALAPLGVAAERERFVPHVTLGRVRGRIPPAAVEAVRGLGTLGRVRAAEVILFDSELRAQGAEHRALARFPLAG